MASYATLSDLKAYLGISSSETDDDALLSDLLERISARIDRETGRRFQAVTETHYFESDALDPTVNTLWVDDDLLTVTTLTNGDSDNETIPSTEYWLIPRNRSPKWGIRLKSDTNYSWEWDTDQWVAVTGTWGWSATPPDDIVEACVEWAAYAYHAKDSAGPFDVSGILGAGIITIPKGIPAPVKQALHPYKKGIT